MGTINRVIRQGVVALVALTAFGICSGHGAKAAVMISELDLFDSPFINTSTLYASKIVDIGPQTLTPDNPSIEIWIDFLGHQQIVLTDPVPNSGDDERGGLLIVNPHSSGSCTGAGCAILDIVFAYSGESNSDPDGTNPDPVSGVICEAVGTCSLLGHDRTDGVMS